MERERERERESGETENTTETDGTAIPRSSLQVGAGGLPAQWDEKTARMFISYHTVSMIYTCHVYIYTYIYIYMYIYTHTCMCIYVHTLFMCLLIIVMIDYMFVEHLAMFTPRDNFGSEAWIRSFTTCVARRCSG